MSTTTFPTAPTIQVPTLGSKVNAFFATLTHALAMARVVGQSDRVTSRQVKQLRAMAERF